MKLTPRKRDELAIQYDWLWKETGMFGSAIEDRRNSGLTETRYSWQVAQPRYADKVHTAQAVPKQMVMPLDPTIDFVPISGKPLFEIYHAVAPDVHFEPRPDLWQNQRSRAFWLAAIVEASSLEEAFDVSNGEAMDCLASSVLWRASAAVRPTSVGDVMVSRDSGEAWMVHKHGFWGPLESASDLEEVSLSYQR